MSISVQISGITTSLSKNKIRQLLSVDDKEVSETTFRRLCVKWKLAEVVGLQEEEFKKKKVFWGAEAENLIKYLGIDEE